MVGEVIGFLEGRIDAAVLRGPGASDPRRSRRGFGKTLAHNLALVAGLERIRAVGRPVVIGLSRKGLIGLLTGRPIEGRLAGSLAGALAAVGAGRRLLRVHDVAETVDALRVWDAIGRVAP